MCYSVLKHGFKSVVIYYIVFDCAIPNRTEEQKCPNLSHATLLYSTLPYPTLPYSTLLYSTLREEGREGGLEADAEGQMPWRVHVWLCG